MSASVIADCSFEFVHTVELGNEEINFTRAQGIGRAMCCHEQAPAPSLDDVLVSVAADSTGCFAAELDDHQKFTGARPLGPRCDSGIREPDDISASSSTVFMAGERRHREHPGSSLANCVLLRGASSVSAPRGLVVTLPPRMAESIFAARWLARFDAHPRCASPPCMAGAGVTGARAQIALRVREGSLLDARHSSSVPRASSCEPRRALPLEIS